MRLLVISELFLPTKGGTAIWAAEVYRRLGGKDLHIVTADVPGADKVDVNHPNTIHRLNLKRFSWLRPESLMMYLRLLGKSVILASTHRFDAVHAMRALPEGLVAWIVGRLTFRPVLIYAHGEELTSWGKGRKYKVMRYALRHADKVIANSEFTRDKLLRMGIHATGIVLIHPGVDVARFRPGLPCDDLKARIGFKQGQKLILSVGRLSRRKGFDMVIRSLPGLAEKGLDVHYVVIGIGEDWDYLHELASEMNVAERVNLLGHVSTEDLPRWYNACDVFAMPNREIHGDTEGFGMVLIEAAACGKPAIAGRAGGVRQAVVDRVTGISVDGDHSGGVAEALATLVSDAKGAERMGAAGRKRVLDEFSWARVAAQTLSAGNANT